MERIVNKNKIPFWTPGKILLVGTMFIGAILLLFWPDGPKTASSAVGAAVPEIKIEKIPENRPVSSDKVQNNSFRLNLSDRQLQMALRKAVPKIDHDFGSVPFIGRVELKLDNYEVVMLEADVGLTADVNLKISGSAHVVTLGLKLNRLTFNVKDEGCIRTAGVSVTQDIKDSDLPSAVTYLIKSWLDGKELGVAFGDRSIYCLDDEDREGLSYMGMTVQSSRVVNGKLVIEVGR